MLEASTTVLIVETLRPLLKRLAQQMARLGLVSDREDFEANWLNKKDAYSRLDALGIIEIFEIVENLDMALRVQEAAFRARWETGVAKPAKRRTGVKLRAVHILQAQLRAWKRRSAWPFVRIA